MENSSVPTKLLGLTLSPLCLQYLYRGHVIIAIVLIIATYRLAPPVLPISLPGRPAYQPQAPSGIKRIESHPHRQARETVNTKYLEATKLRNPGMTWAAVSMPYPTRPSAPSSTSALYITENDPPKRSSTPCCYPRKIGTENIGIQYTWPDMRRKRKHSGTPNEYTGLSGNNARDKDIL